jgi:hypothetical protein
MAHKVAQAQLKAFILIGMKVSFFLDLSSQKEAEPDVIQNSIGNLRRATAGWGYYVDSNNTTWDADASVWV